MKNNEKICRIEVAIENALLKSGRENIVHYFRIYQHWQVIIGEALAQKTFPKKFERGVLTVLVEDAAYAYHLRYFRDRILELISSPAICGENVVRDIKYSVGQIPKRLDSPPKGLEKTRVKRKRKILRDPALKKSILKIQDPRLQKKFSQLVTKVSLRHNLKNG